MSFKIKFKFLLKRLTVSSLDVALLKRKRLAHYFLDNPGSTLDVGCGNGDFSYLALKKGGTVLGITLFPEEASNCERYRDALGIAADKLQFKTMNVFKVQDLKREFDQIICFEVIEHIKDDKKFIDLLSNILKPGGVIHICTPNSDGPELFGDIIETEASGGHVRKGYTYEELNKLLTDAGLVLKRKDSYGGYFTVKSIELMRRAQLSKIRCLNKNFRFLRFLIFSLTYPLTFLDSFIRCQPLSLYVMAKKSS